MAPWPRGPVAPWSPRASGAPRLKVWRRPAEEHRDRQLAIAEDGEGIARPIRRGATRGVLWTRAVIAHCGPPTRRENTVKKLTSSKAEVYVKLAATTGTILTIVAVVGAGKKW